jgi:hypothetical protein
MFSPGRALGVLTLFLALLAWNPQVGYGQLCPADTQPYTIEFESDKNGDPFVSGDIVSGSSRFNGLSVSAINSENGSFDDDAVIFDSSCPGLSGFDSGSFPCSGGDPDLGTPNENYCADGSGPVDGTCTPGPGIGSGGASSPGANTQPEGNILILQANSKGGNGNTKVDRDGDAVADEYEDPDDQAGNCTDCRIIFTFDEAVRIDNVFTIDADGDFVTVNLYDSQTGGTLIGTQQEQDNGNNSVETLNFGSSDGDPAEVFRLEAVFTGSGGVGAISGCFPDNPLPVELTKFDATLDGETALLRWATASETNNAGFEVQHQAPETGSFETLTFVDGHGTTELPKQYAHRIEGLAPGPHQFRLRQVDFDGTFEFSPTVEVYVGLPDTYVVDPVYPNPFNPQATLRFGVQQAQQVTVDLYDITGRQVDVLYQGTLSAGQFETVTLDGSDLSSGVYLVRVQGETFVETQNVTLMK